MIYIYKSTSFNPFYNLAIEDYMIDYAQKNPDVMFVYFWQNDNTVVIGRNQDAFCECNIENLKRYNAFLARRKTGGGAVFHDKDNLNFSFVIPQKIFNKKESMQIITTALCKIGINAEISGRNDILVNGAKCSGSAYLNKQNVVLHHGTMLINTNVEMMQKLLNVNSEKLKAKGVQSVKSRVVNLQSVSPDIDADKVSEAIKKAFEEKYKMKCIDFVLNKEEIISREMFFADDKWRFGDKKFATVKNYDKKFDWGICSIKILKSADKQIVKIYSDALDCDTVEYAEKLLNSTVSVKFDIQNKIIVEIFEFYNYVLSLQ